MTGADFAGLTIAAARRALAARMRDAHFDSPDLDARMLAGLALGLDLTGLSLAADRRLTPGDAARLAALARRRLAHEPIARIAGEREFWGLRLALSADTLVPRPETETAVEAALAALPPPRPGVRPLIADVGTGSGAILLALLHERPDAVGVGADISAEAAHTARGNARRLGLAARATFVVGDMLAPLRGPFDLIVSNPPYIASADIAGLDLEVREHDPRRALDGGGDGLDAYRALAAQAPGRLARGAALAVEIGFGQADDVAAILSGAGLGIAGAARCDLGGVPRAIVAVKPE